MYTILGTDGREYGPASADQVREWIASGRANLSTRVRLQGTAEWRMLSEFPEFAATSPGQAPPPLSGQGSATGKTFCRNCAREVHPQAVACPACGVPPKLEKKFCPNCAAPTQANQTVCTRCGVSLAAAGDGGKSKIAAGLLGILLGSLGIHKFYLGYNLEGAIMLIATLVTCGFAAAITGIVGLVEGIIYLTKTDEEFAHTYVYGRRTWF